LPPRAPDDAVPPVRLGPMPPVTHTSVGLSIYPSADQMRLWLHVETIFF